MALMKTKTAALLLALMVLLSLTGCSGRPKPDATAAATSTLAPSTPVPTPASAPPVAQVSPLLSPLPAPPVASQGEVAAVPVYTFEVVAEYPHDPSAYTQGLEWADGALYEGTGLYGESSLRRVALADGAVEQGVLLPEQYFGEGITLLGDKIYQLTWQSNTGFVYDAASFDVLDSFQYPTEGWGLTHDGEALIMSDGSATLYWRDAGTLAETRRVTVTDGGAPVTRLNELEFVQGEVWANVWHSDRIARIEPANGNVVGWIDLAGLMAPEERNGPESVLNGIAYDAEGDRIFVTGKLWPKLFEIRVLP